MREEKREVMEEERLRFADGAERIHNVKKKEADQIFDLIEKVCRLWFQQVTRCSLCQDHLSNGLLKAFHPIAFYAAQVTVHGASTTTVAKYLREARDHGIRILAPCINRGALRFRPEGEESLRFGLSAIKGLGDAALSELLRAREAGDEFQGLIDLAKRCEPRRLSEKLWVSSSMQARWIALRSLVADSSPASKPFIGWRLEPTVIERQVR